MKQSIRKKVLLAILLVTILTSCCITVVFYFRSASMIEKIIQKPSTRESGRLWKVLTIP